MTILRRKVRLNQPYAGVFVKLDDENDSEVVDNIMELHDVGTFVQIMEMQDFGNRYEREKENIKSLLKQNYFQIENGGHGAQADQYAAGPPRRTGGGRAHDRGGLWS